MGEFWNPVLETLDPERLRAIQLRKFQRVIGWTYERSRLYRDREDRDPLTGLMNRRAFLAALAPGLSAARRRNRRLTLVLADLDGFRAVNEEHGYLLPDSHLRGLEAQPEMALAGAFQG